MLTQNQVLEAIKSGRESVCLDGRDFIRLAEFFPASELAVFGLEFVDGQNKPLPLKEWTREEIVNQLRADVAFGFKKALNRRGISASLMYSTVKTFLWVLEDDLQHCEEYAQYGLPLFRKVAIKYGFPNEIGDDTGDETKYAADDDCYL